MKNLELLIPKSKPDPDLWRWATVTAVDPLRIRLDGEAQALDITPDNTSGPLAVGNRVWTQTSGRRILVVGNAQLASDDVGTIKLFLNPDPPPNHLPLTAAGTSFLPADYPELAAAVGDRHGAIEEDALCYLPPMEPVLDGFGYYLYYMIRAR